MVFPFHTVTRSAQETKKLGAQLGAYLLNSQIGERADRVLCLYGELGSGKTTFVQGLAASFGIIKRILSPTFIIVRHYDIPKTKFNLYHIDLYRLRTGQDLVSVGILEIFSNTHAFVCVEWPERLGSLLPKKRMDIRFETLKNGTHKINIDEI